VNHATGPHLFCVPGAADTPLQYRPLGRRLADVSVYAFAYRGMDHRAVPDQTVAAIARRNVAALRAVDHSGPYRLLGYSFGGPVALVMAQLLVASGAEVELLVLLEPSFRPPGGNSPAERSRAFADRARDRVPDSHSGRDLGALLARARAIVRTGAESLERRLRLASAGIVPRRGLPQHDLFFQLHTRMLAAHRPVPYRGPTVVFASPRYLELAAPMLDELLPSETAGGRRRDVPLAGEHLDLVREPNVAEVARVLDSLLVADPS
jgi:thioesterase domain-containing protein